MKKYILILGAVVLKYSRLKITYKCEIYFRLQVCEL